jgi:choline transporter-like protein 2/4/5
MTVAGAISHWYFARDAQSGYSHGYGSPALTSFARALTKSFGSLALGSLLIAIVQFLNLLLSQAKRANRLQRQNRVAQCLISCAQCALRCVEGMIKFVNRFTYIYIGKKKLIPAFL